MSISDRNEQPDESSGARSVTCCWHSSHSFSKVGWLLANIGKLAAVEPGGLPLILLRHTPQRGGNIFGARRARLIGAQAREFHQLFAFHGRSSAESRTRLIRASGLINQRLDSHSSCTDNMITNSPQVILAKRDLPPCLNHLASRRETERIFLNVVGAKMRLLRRGDPTRDGVDRTVSAKRREMPSTCPRLQ